MRRAGFGPRERRRARELLARVALVDADRRILAAAAERAHLDVLAPA
ncbi:MAG: hypothetical protein HYV94_05435 [Candidatus Rokubacteria bacterium]|nr:hypothetical protein [Candidatus Rokubacteria bacterium]